MGIIIKQDTPRKQRHSCISVCFIHAQKTGHEKERERERGWERGWEGDYITPSVILNSNTTAISLLPEFLRKCHYHPTPPTEK